MTQKSLLGSFDNLTERQTYDSNTVGNVINITADLIMDCNKGSSFRHLSQTGNRTYIIKNFKDGASITALISGQANDNIQFTVWSGDGTGSLTVKYGAGQSGIMASAYTLFTFYRAGGDLNWTVVGPIHGIS